MPRKKTTTIEQDLPDPNLPAFFQERQGSVKIARTYPRDGHLRRVPAREIDDLDEYLQENWGGGTYQVTYTPPIEEKDQKEITRTVKIAGEPRSAAGGKRGGRGDLMAQMMDELRETRMAMDALRDRQAMKHQEDYSLMLKQQAESQANTTATLVAIMEQGARRDAERAQNQMTQMQQWFTLQQTAQETRFARELERGRMHTQEMMQLLSASQQQSSPMGQLETMAKQVEVIKALLPEPGGPWEKLIDKSPDLISGISDGVKAVFSEAKERRKPKNPKRRKKERRQGSSAQDKGDGIEIPKADAEAWGDDVAAQSKANGRALPEPTQRDDDDDDQAESVDDEMLLWEEFTGWFNFLTMTDPDSWLETIYLAKMHDRLPELMIEPVEKAMQGDYTGIQELFAEMDALELLEEFQKTLPQQLGRLQAKITAAEKEAGNAGSGTSPEVES